MVTMPELNSEFCDGCGLCFAACHGGAIKRESGKITITETESCDFCGVCEAVCPRKAIKCCYNIVCTQS